MISVSGDCLPFIFKLLSNCYRQKMILAKICPKIRDQQIHILSISGHCMCFIFKICQIYADISMSQSISPIFKNLIFGGFLPFGPTLRCRTRQSCCQIIALRWLVVIIRGSPTRFHWRFSHGLRCRRASHNESKFIMMSHLHFI